MPEDITKLPKWAQRRFRRLEETAAEAERKLDDVLGRGPHDSNVCLYELKGLKMYERPLPHDATVRFMVGQHVLDVKIKKDSLRIFANDSLLWARSDASNVLLVRPEEY